MANEKKESSSSDSSIAIKVAIIGLIGTIIAALIGNFDKLTLRSGEGIISEAKKKGPDSSKTEAPTNLRIGPGFEYQVLMILSRGTKFTLLETKNGWLKVKLDDGTIGFIHQTRIGIQ